MLAPLKRRGSPKLELNMRKEFTLQNSLNTHSMICSRPSAKKE